MNYLMSIIEASVLMSLSDPIHGDSELITAYYIMRHIM